jgi:hypothetical protein
MNKRIKELISQSYEYSTITTIDPFTQEVVTDYIDCTKPIFNKEKFAELIVKECADLCDRYQKIPATEPRHCANDIRSMFGIKQPEEEENE